MARPQKSRRICHMPVFNTFVPSRNPSPDEAGGADAIVLTVDEFEVLRLVDFEGITHSECAKQMNISRTTATEICESARKKVPAELLERASFETFTDGPSVQMLHVGPYDTEPETFAAMNAFLKENGLVRTEQVHREIYLSDPRRVSPEKNRTLLRFFHLNAAPVAGR